MEMLVTKLSPHPLNERVYGEETLTKEFVDSIGKQGILVPLAVKENGVIISGHRRWQAAKSLSMITAPVRIVEYGSEIDEREAIIDFNKQREKTFSQKMAEAEELEAIERERAKERQGQRTDLQPPDIVETFPPSPGKTRDKVAAKVGIGSGKQYEKAKKVWEQVAQGNEKAKAEVEKIDKGQATVHSAYKKVFAKQEEPPPEMPEGEYQVILADPPWRYEFSETSTRQIENQYPTMGLEDIKNLDIPSADKAVLFLWATSPKLEEALEVLRAWGFTYKTCAVWDKEVIGMGYWFRGQHELLLVGTKGGMEPPGPEKRVSSVIRERRDKHSKKPGKVYEIIESMFPGRKCVELFAREQRPGWGSWGNEV